MSLQPLYTISRLKDPLKQFQVSFTISSIPALALAKVEQKASGLLTGNTPFAKADELELRCTSFSYPGTKIKQSELCIGGFTRKIGAIQDKSGTWQCTITEDYRGSILNTIQAWCDLIHNPFSGATLPSTMYVSTCVVRILNAKGDAERTLWLKGFYPIEYKVSDIGTSASEAVEITITWNYDWWTETPTSVAAFGVNSSITKAVGL